MKWVEYAFSELGYAQKGGARLRTGGSTPSGVYIIRPSIVIRALAPEVIAGLPQRLKPNPMLGLEMHR